MTVVSGFPSQCGVSIIHELGNQDAKQQFDKLKEVLLNSNGTPRQAMVLFSDTEDSGYWLEAKKFAVRSRAVENPNSHNMIRVYIFRIEHLKDFEKNLNKKK